MRLSKTKLLAGLQCPKRLYLTVHQPELALVDAGLEARFAVGHEVGAVARALYPEGQLIGHPENPGTALRDTQAALQRDGDLLLFEPAFTHGSVLVRADLLFRRKGRHRLVEVKASTSVHDHHIQDAAIQAWVIDGAGCPVDGAAIAHIDSSFVYPGEGRYEGLLKSIDVTDDVARLRDQVPELALKCQQIVQGPLPEIAVGSQCHDPYDCPFLAHCSDGAPEYPVSILPYGGRVVAQLTAKGYEDLREVPGDALESRNHQRVWRCTVSGQAELDPAAAAVLEELAYPRYYLDFETIQFAVPIWAGMRPYEQLPFQWSCHVEDAQGDLTQADFLDTSGAPPMRLCMEALIAALGSEGPILIYTGFERRILREAAQREPDLAPALEAIVARTFDLCEVARMYYYHPAMKGSWSIKKVLPTIAPELDYANLVEVSDGGGAQAAYLEIVAPETPLSRKAHLVDALRTYCARDTLGMVRMAAHFAFAGNDR